MTDDLDTLSLLAGFRSWPQYLEWWHERFPRYGAHEAWFFLAGRAALVTGVMTEPPDPTWLEYKYESAGQIDEDREGMEPEPLEIEVPRMHFGPSPQMQAAMADSLGRSITCPECSMTSYNVTDIREGWCGKCNKYTSPRRG